VLYSENVALRRRYVMGWYGDDPAAAAAAGAAGVPGARCSGSVLTHEANYHADGGQIIAAPPGSTRSRNPCTSSPCGTRRQSKCVM
jgi:hypothetical protein